MGNTLSVSEEIKEEVEKQKKSQILESYLDKKPISKSKWDWMERNDWHPVDEMEFISEFVERINKLKNNQLVRFKIA